MRLDYLAGLVALSLATFVGVMAHATVTQVDGTIIPIAGSEVQAELDAEEGAGVLDMNLDAAEQPEIFLPNTAQPVVFFDIAEQADFENSIGWYNVGDDIITTAGRAENLHPILGCGVPMQDHPYNAASPDTGHHHGDPSMYIENANPGEAGNEEISVDFAEELLAGRYKGGFIGFYIITPENIGGGDFDCGDFVTGVNNSGFGFIYHTEKDLNDDGDFVHHLVYTSAVTTDRFYFAFEDLFRGGDNDFSDMMLRVDGLTPPCIPTVEICDGLDNDCDGLVDEIDADLTGVGDACLCDGVAMTCADGPVFGVCQEGQTICSAGAIECESINNGSSEVCDLLDNDCDNSVDESPVLDPLPGTGGACDGPDSDLCPEGIIVCEVGILVCNDDTGPNPETCDGFDNDCDTFVDEDLVDEGDVCGDFFLGECNRGNEVCVDGVLECQGDVGPTDELCNGLDDDCDGIPDDGPTDVGGSCGTTDEGSCEFGTLVCTQGTRQCVGEVGPQTETCNLTDDDCDTVVDNNPVDVGSPCGTDTGVCSPGVIECTVTGPECVGETTGTSEECNSLDDNCDGFVDNDPAGVDVVCGDTDGVCEPGLTKCINGGLECVGGYEGTTEICNGIDDDCDGEPDDGDLCNGGACVNGVCSTPCDGREFSCPINEMCESGFCVTNPCYNVDCPLGNDGTLNICEEGVCIPICNTQSCPEDFVCRATDGACVPNNCNFLPLCTDDQVCKDSECVSDPCFEIDCAEAEFCREGLCVASCGGIECDDGEHCVDGLCEATGCGGDCPTAQVCDSVSGLCIQDPCARVNCQAGEACDQGSGDCVSDPCVGIECPLGTVCDFGGCYDSPDVVGDAGPDPQYVSPGGGGGGGCSAAGNEGNTGLWMLLAGLILLSLRRRKVAVSPSVVALCALVVPTGACSLNPFCVNCETTDNNLVGDAGIDIDADVVIPIDAAPGCEDGVGFPETCDGLDNDCDGFADEDFDLSTDFFHCGVCGNDCEKAGTKTACIEGSCEAVDCFPGNVDVNGDVDDAFADSDGCEYGCFVSNGGVEACDGLDNDCDGATDEDTDLQTDEENCGQCGGVCDRFAATATCTAGLCGFDPVSDCNTGFIDVNLVQDDGCEYSCTPSNGGTESCDLVDNDCDGVVDEGFDTDTNVLHCGQCDRVCEFAQATPSCASGGCTFNGATDCDAGFHDLNGITADGCEYACTQTNGGVEVCDVIDNDCDGVIDGVTTDSGLACNNGPLGVPTGICTNTGSTVCSLGLIVCVGAPEATVEICNGDDDDCDGSTDESLTQACYTGPDNTLGIGDCAAGLQTCTGGTFAGAACVGDTTPGTETCDNADQDCDGAIDEAAAGGPIVQSCYDGADNTAGVGECVAGSQTCTFGVFGTCQGQVVDTTDICGDGADSDCDALDDGGEGCMVAEPSDLNIDGNNNHSFDLHLAAGGATVGERVYAAWSDLRNGNSDIYFARSPDGGANWETAVNLTETLGRAAVKPIIVVAPGAVDDVHVVYQSVNEGVRSIRVQTSVDSGANFTAPSGALDGVEDSFHHHAAVSDDGSSLAIVWEELDTGTLAREINSRISIDSGSTFEGQRTINSGAGPTLAGRPQVGITNSGRYIYVWREIRVGVTTDVYSVFSDSATTAIDSDDEVRLDADVGDILNSNFPVLRIAAQAVYVVWQDVSTVPGAGSDVAFVRSATNGATYSAEAIIDDPAGEQSSSFTPTMDVDPAGAGAADDRVFIAWEDRREGTQIYTSTSSDGGQGFDAPVRASSDAGDPATGITRSPQLVYTGGDAVVVAYLNDLATGTEHVFAATSIDAGVSWGFSHQQLDTGIGAALGPAIVEASDVGLNNGSCVGWNDFRSAPAINGDPYVRRIGQ